MDLCPFGRASTVMQASWKRTSDLEKDFKTPRLPANRGVLLLTRNQNERKNMNKYKTQVPTRFAPETRFELRPAPSVPFRAAQETEFERLKNKLLAEQLLEATPELNAPLRRAANDA